MEVVFIGTGASEGIPVYGCKCPSCMEALRDKRLWRKTTSLLVTSSKGYSILVDAGPDSVSWFLSERDIGVEALFLTHWHHDHYTGLYMLRWSPKPLILYHPGGPVDQELVRLPLSLRFSRIDAYKCIEVRGFRVYTVPLNHSIPTLGYIVCEDGVCIAILFDTKGMSREAIEFTRRLEPVIAVIDATFRPGMDKNGHNNVDEALAIGRELGVEKTILTHIAHHNLPYSKLQEYVKRENALIALDNMVLKI